MISIVIPAYNEEEALGGVIEELRAVIEPLSDGQYQVIVVDDASTDGTAETAKRLGAKVVTHLSNFGYGRSLKDGIRNAKFDTILMTDADGTYPADAVPEMLSQFERGHSMVVAKRSGKHYRESWLKMPLRWLLEWLVQFATGTRIPDVNSGLRVLSKAEVLPHLDRLSNTFSFTTSVTLAYLLTGKSVHYVPTEYRERVGKSKVMLFRDSLRTLQYIVQAILVYNPIKLFLVLCGIAVAFGGFLWLLALLFQWSWAALAGSLAFLVALVLFGVGLVADILRLLLTRLDE